MVAEDDDHAPAGARRFLLKLLQAADDLQRFRLAIDDVAELHQRRPAAGPMAARVEQAGCARDGHPRLEIAVKVTDRDDAAGLSRRRGGAVQREQQRKREPHQANAAHQASRHGPLRHAGSVAPLIRAGNAVNHACVSANCNDSFRPKADIIDGPATPMWASI